MRCIFGRERVWIILAVAMAIATSPLFCVVLAYVEVGMLLAREGWFCLPSLGGCASGVRVNAVLGSTEVSLDILLAAASSLDAKDDEVVCFQLVFFLQS